MCLIRRGKFTMVRDVVTLRPSNEFSSMPHPPGYFERHLADAPDFAAFFASPAATEFAAFLDARLQPLRMLSLDVFDTLLLRDHRSELERFADVARRFAAGLPDGSPSARACLIARIEAAHAAYAHAVPLQGTREGRLTDIAETMMSALRLPPQDHARHVQNWIAAELATEVEQLALSPFATALIDRAARAGKRVILLSDMYLDAGQITLLLKQKGFDPSRLEAVISSADLTLNKRSGTIFAHLERQFDLEGHQILHLGDSLGSDFRAPLAAGWQAQFLPIPDKLLSRRLDSHRKTATALFGDADFPLLMAQPALPA